MLIALMAIFINVQLVIPLMRPGSFAEILPLVSTRLQEQFLIELAIRNCPCLNESGVFSTIHIFLIKKSL